jgi:hypothetical protein
MSIDFPNHQVVAQRWNRELLRLHTMRSLSGGVANVFDQERTGDVVHGDHVLSVIASRESLYGKNTSVKGCVPFMRGVSKLLRSWFGEGVKSERLSTCPAPDRHFGLEDNIIVIYHRGPKNFCQELANAPNSHIRANTPVAMSAASLELHHTPQIR